MTHDGRCAIHAIGQEMCHLDLTRLKAGDLVRTLDGSAAEVVRQSEDGKWILVRYVDSKENPRLVGTEDLCSDDEVAEQIIPGKS